MRQATIVERETYFRTKAICKPAIEANGLLDDGKASSTRKIPKPSTRQDLANSLNELARRVHIERTPLNPGGYFATADNIG